MFVTVVTGKYAYKNELKFSSWFIKMYDAPKMYIIEI